MSRARAKKPSAPVTYVPPESPPSAPPAMPRQPWPAPVMQFSMWSGIQRVSLSKVTELKLWLPPWQRGQVWDGERQRSFCRSVWRRLPIMPILLWERGWMSGARYVVLDGQQRLAALGVPMARHDGTVTTLPASFLDLEDGEWKPEPSPIDPALPVALTAAELASGSWSKQRGCEDRAADLYAMAIDRLRVDVPAYILGPEATQEQAMEVFRCWNLPGVAFEPGEVDALIRAASAPWDAPEVSRG